MDKFRERMIQEFKPMGFKFFRETVWSSSIQQVNLPKIRYFLSKNNFNNIDVSIIIPPDDKTFRMSWKRYYQKSGQCISSIQEIPIAAESNHLKLTFCYVSEEMRFEGKAQTIIVANALRLVFGVPVARELIFTRYFSEDEEEKLFSDEAYASMFDTQSLNMFINPSIEEAELTPIPEEAAILLDKSFAQTYPVERYILMWLAFVAIINSVVENGKDGDKRQTFFKETLKSNIANTEVLRLFKLRCSIFKEGQSASKDIENDCWSLYAALQISIMKDCDQRRAFLSGYENTINQRVTASRL